MARHVFDVGVDVMARQDRPEAGKPDAPSVLLAGAQGAQKQTFLRFADVAEKLRGETVLTAEFTGRARSDCPAFQVTIAPLADQLRVGQVWWAQRPPVVAAAGQVTANVPATSAGARWASAVDVEALAQAIADGGHLGWRLSTDANQDRELRSFNSGDAWRLVVVTSDLPDAPTSLEPAGGAVGLDRPTFTWQVDDPDPGDGEVSPQLRYHFQLDTPPVDADPDENTPDVDTGWKPSLVGQHSLAGGAYALTAHRDAYWRVRTQGASQQPSEWSDWVRVVFVPYNTGTITSPAGAQLFDQSPNVEGTVSGNVPPVESRWRVIDVTTGDERYDSGWEGVPNNNGQTVLHAIPFRDDTFPGVVLPHRGPWLLDWRYVDIEGRVPSPGDPGFVRVTREVTLSDAGNPAPRLISVEQASDRKPFADLTVGADAAPDAWEIIRDDRSALEVPHADMTRVGNGVWEYRDNKVTPGLHAYTVRSLTLNGGQRARSKPSGERLVQLAVKGFWLVRDNGDACCLAGDYGDIRERWLTETHQPMKGPKVKIVYDYLGYGGAFEGVLSRANFETTEEFEAHAAVLDAIKRRPLEPVRAVWAEASVPMELDQMSVHWGVSDDGSGYRPNTRAHRVSFECWQIDELELLDPPKKPKKPGGSGGGGGG